jgi:hypothetical protein
VRDDSAHWYIIVGGAQTQRIIAVIGHYNALKWLFVCAHSHRAVVSNALLAPGKQKKGAGGSITYISLSSPNQF